MCHALCAGAVGSRLRNATEVDAVIISYFVDEDIGSEKLNNLSVS